MKAEKSTSKQIHSFFSAIAPRYDLVNALMSVGLHHVWNQKLVNSLHSYPEASYLDLCSGTGAIAKRYLKKYSPTQTVVLVDFCEKMLEIAGEKLSKDSFSLEFVVADARELPFQSEKFDRISLSYGLRNIDPPEKALEECFRALKKGGLLAILELTRPKAKLLRLFHRFWLKNVALPLGAFFSSSAEAYLHLKNSIEQFRSADDILKDCRQAGFIDCSRISLAGGIATIFLARKPSTKSKEN